MYPSGHVYFFSTSFQLAYKVTSSHDNNASLLITVPFLSSQETNVYPSLVGALGSVNVLPQVTVTALTLLPPFESNDTLNVFGSSFSQYAYKVTSSHDNNASLCIVVPFLSSQETNLYPSFFGLLGNFKVLPHTTVI